MVAQEGLSESDATVAVVACDPGSAGAIVGTDGDDTLIGTSGDDLIIGLAGNDTIRGLGGDDRICGGDGEDILRGDSGDDEILGGTGNDQIRGNAGNDSLHGEQGDDDLRGSTGDDYIRGGDGADTVRGETGSDTCSGETVRSCEIDSHIVGGNDVSGTVSYMQEQYDMTLSNALRAAEQEQLLNPIAVMVVEEYGDDPRFNEIWIDHASSSRVYISTTDGAFSRAIRDEVEQLEPNLTYRRDIAEFGLSELLDIQDQIDAAVDIGGVGLPWIATTVLPMENEVLVELSASAPLLTSSALDGVLALLPDGAVRVVTPQWTELDPGGEVCPQSSCTARGAIELRGPSGAGCSLGYTVSASSVDGFSTAGHCGDPDWPTGTDVDHGGIGHIGEVDDTRDSGSVDGKHVDFTATGASGAELGRIWTTGDPLQRVTDVLLTSEIALGSTVCRSGYRIDGEGGGQDCGELISNSVSRSGNTNLGRGEHVGGCAGDSGGPWWRDSDDAAVGSHQGGDDTDFCPAPFEEDSYFSFMSYLQGEFGFATYTG